MRRAEEKQSFKMLYFMFLFIISLGFVTPRPDEVIVLPVPAVRVPILLHILNNCAGKAGVDSNAVQRLREMKFEDNEPENKLLYCFVTVSRTSDKNGRLSKEQLSQLVDDGNKSTDEFLKVIDECNKLKGNDEYKTTYKIVNCFRNKSPILFKF